jgi:YVTN family beta-propeller protein
MLTPTSVSFNNKHIFVTNFGSNTVSVIDKLNFSINNIKTGKTPLKSCILNNKVYFINHLDRTIGNLEKEFFLPVKGLPDNIFVHKKRILITAHSGTKFSLISFNPENNKIKVIYSYSYPYGQTNLNTKNSAFFMNGQYADSIFELNKILIYENSILITDYISGKLFILKDI